MPPKKQWDEEEDDSSSAPSSPPVVATRRAPQFDDEEGEDSDVLESWDAEDSEVEREKAKKAAEAKAKATAAAAAKKKPKTQRIAEHQADRARRKAEGDDSSEEDDEATRRERIRRTEQEADLKHAEDMFGDIGISASRKGNTAGAAVIVDAKDPTKTVNIAQLPLFNPSTKTQFEALRTTLTPIIGDLSKKPHYALFLQELVKQLAKDLPSDQIKKISSTLTTLGNEKMKEEKAADRGGKKTKAQKTKTTLVANRTANTDVNTYEETFGDDDFM